MHADSCREMFTTSLVFFVYLHTTLYTVSLVCLALLIVPSAYNCWKCAIDIVRVGLLLLLLVVSFQPLPTLFYSLSSVNIIAQACMSNHAILSVGLGQRQTVAAICKNEAALKIHISTPAWLLDSRYYLP